MRASIRENVAAGSSLTGGFTGQVIPAELANWLVSEFVIW